MCFCLIDCLWQGLMYGRQISNSVMPLNCPPAFTSWMLGLQASIPPWPVCLVLGVEPKASYLLGKPSTNWATPQPRWFFKSTVRYCLLLVTGSPTVYQGNRWGVGVDLTDMKGVSLSLPWAWYASMLSVYWCMTDIKCQSTQRVTDFNESKKEAIGTEWDTEQHPKIGTESHT